jgi:D-alanine-D-alanine ligase
MNIAFTYNVKHNTSYSLSSEQTDLEFDSQEVIDAIDSTLKELGHTVLRIEADLDAFSKLRANANNIDIVFNVAEGLGGDARESQIPLFCEMLDIPYTHSSPTTHALKLDKHLTKQLLHCHGINVPKSQIFTSASDTLSSDLKFPLIVKPLKQGSSKGIFNDSVVNSSEELTRIVEKVLMDFDRAALVEEYIDGREFTVAMLGNPPEILPIIEQRFDFLPAGFNKVAGYELKWIYEDKLANLSDAYVCPAKVTKELEESIHDTCNKAWEVLNVKDCARIDLRVSSEGKVYFIEINTLPGINPDENSICYFVTAARAAGLSYKDMIARILASAMSRYGIRA